MLIALIATALAQQEACTPQAPATFAQALDAVEPLLSEDLSTASTTLDAAAEVARCLSEPVEPSVLARFAWYRAEVASLNQEEVATWAWATAAGDAGSDAPAERVPPFHPLRTLLEEAPEDPPMGGPEGVGLAVPKKGTLYADGKPLSTPRVRMETPHLVQVFDRDGELFLSMWQNGAAFSPTLLSAGEERARPTADAHDAVPPENWKPARLGTVEAYEKWIAKHPEGPWLQEAKDAIDEMAWEEARKTDTDLAYRQYVHDFPEGLHVRQAQLLVEHHAYLEVMERPTREKWKEFLKRFDEGTYANEARMQIDTIDWRVAQKSNTPDAYRTFITQHPKSPNVERATAREEETTFDGAAQVLSQGRLEDYLERWPEGRFVEEAKALLGGVEVEDVVLIVEGQLDAAAKEKVRAKVLEVLEERKLPVVEAEGPKTGRLRIRARSGPDGRYLRVKGSVALEYGELQRPLIALKLDTPMLTNADVGTSLGDLLKESMPPFSTWHHPPEDEEDAEKGEGKDGKKKK